MSQTRDLQGREGGVGRGLEGGQEETDLSQELGGENRDGPGLVWG